MLSKYVGKNKFGGYTYQIKLDSLFHIYINETENNLFLVEFKEFKWISFKTHFTFISKSNIEETIIDTFEKVYEFYDNHPKYEWSEQACRNKLNHVLDLLDRIEK
ncbi:MAG: hypothetical protein IPK18_12435 [Sphingobacteriales bacterium]|jgi:hypothetical protein|nr:MAG: hypothetical protein IPK18_12435 [Sphingobacteriales bacterium]